MQEDEIVDDEPVKEPGRSSIWGALSWIRDLAFSVLIAVVLIVFIYQPVKVEGTSMMPTLTDQERIFINKFTYQFGLGNIERGDTVVFWYPDDPTKSYIKRVIGLPGDLVRIESGQVYVNDRALKEDYVPDEYRDTVSWPRVAKGSRRRTNWFCRSSISCWETIAALRATAAPGASCRATTSTVRPFLCIGRLTRWAGSDNAALQFPRHPHHRRQQNAEHDARGYREIECGIFPLDVDVARQAPEPEGRACSEAEQQARRYQEKAEDDQGAAQGHTFSLSPGSYSAAIWPKIGFSAG